ncbi:MAG: hypothetical protein ACPHRO_05630 [Nannocystaceae bacterium]
MSRRARARRGRPYVAWCFVLGTSCAGVGTGCQQKKAPTDVELSDLEVAIAAVEIPSEPRVLLEALFPQHEAQIKVTYGIEGTGGMTGSLEVWTASGSLRREEFTATIMGSGKESMTTVEGLAIQRPGILYRRRGADGGESWVRTPYDALATAWSKLPDDRRGRALEHLGDWHKTRATALVADPGEQREVAGQMCRQTRLGGQSICLWEREGVVLAYESEVFTLTALRVETAATVDQDRFAIPPSTEEVPPPSTTLEEEVSRLLLALEEGDMGSLAPLAHPGFRFAASDVGP